jgi:hypothetical protein
VWTQLTTTSYITQITNLETPFSLVTYQANSGYSTNEDSIGFGKGEGFKCHTVVNGRCFVGNIKKKDSRGKSRLYNDRVMYSELNKYDVFPSYNYIDIGIGDGEEVKALASFADRLFIFKKRILYIVNISQGSDTGWYLESTHNNMGVEAPYAVSDTDIGIIWINRYGLFLFNGQNIRNLAEKVSITDWQSDYTITAMVGYDPINRKVIVLNSNTGTSGYAYSFDSNSIVAIAQLFSSGITKTNFFTDRYGQLLLFDARDTTTETPVDIWSGKEG